MGNWWTIRRVLFLALGWLALGLAGFSASRVPPDRTIPYFIGGSVWAVLFFAIALWPRRRAGPRTPGTAGGRADPGAAPDRDRG